MTKRNGLANRNGAHTALGRYMRNWTESGAGADVGDRDVVNDILRQYDQISPIFAAHTNIQRRSAGGNSYAYPKITMGSDGHTKTEASTAAEDTTSAIAIADTSFVTYTGDTVLVSAEMLADASWDVGQEVLSLGLGKTVPLLGANLVAALKSAFNVDTVFTPTQTAGTSWAFSDVVNAYYEIPVRNRAGGVNYTCAPATAKNLTGLLTADTAKQAEMIGFGPDSIVEDAAMDSGLLIVGAITLGLAIGMRVPVRIRRWEVSAGSNFEVNPRFAVGLRDATALACRQLKTS